MTELKTLKDFKGLDVGTGLVKSHINREELKQEAIKQIKELQKIEEIDMIKIPVKKQIEIEKKYFTLFDAVGAYDNSNVIDYIKWKNNITEEDLK